MAQHCSTCSATCATQTPRLYVPFTWAAPATQRRRTYSPPRMFKTAHRRPLPMDHLWTTYTTPIKPPSKNHSQNVSKTQRLRTSLAPAKTATPARRRNRQASLCFSETHRVSEKHVPGRRLGGPRGPTPGRFRFRYPSHSPPLSPQMCQTLEIDTNDDGETRSVLCAVLFVRPDCPCGNPFALFCSVSVRSVCFS